MPSLWKNNEVQRRWKKKKKACYYNCEKCHENIRETYIEEVFITLNAD